MKARRRNRLLAVTVVAAALGACLIWLFGAQTTELVDSYAECANQGYPIEQTDPLVCHAGGRSFIGPSTPAAASLPPVASQPFEILVDGDSRSTYPAGGQAITEQAVWEQFWSAIHTNISPRPPLLPVDFTSHEVLAVSDGPQTTGGYSLEVTAVLSGAAGTTVDYVETYPAIGCPVSDIPSDRYEIVTTALLPGPVSFSLAREPRKC